MESKIIRKNEEAISDYLEIEEEIKRNIDERKS